MSALLEAPPRVGLVEPDLPIPPPRRSSCPPGTVGLIYLIHFDEGLETRPGVFARHYIGWSRSRFINDRLAHHAKGTGSALMAEVERRGIGWHVSRLWRGTRDDERMIKNRRTAPRFCPVCVSKGEAGMTRSHRPVSLYSVPLREVSPLEVWK